MTPELSLKISPQWSEIPRVRRQTAAFLGDQNLHRDVVDAVAMIVCELTENATKYGNFAAREDDHIDVRVALPPGQVMVEVTNPVATSGDDNLLRLDRMVQWIRGFQDPFEAYLQRLKELSVDSLQSTESRLGLVRIAYEGQSVLDFYVDEDNVLAVSAMRHL